MNESVTWSKRLQQIAKWTLIPVVGLLALYIAFSAIAALVVLIVLIVLLGAELGLWEWEVSFG